VRRGSRVQALERDVKSMTDSIASVRQMSAALASAAGTGEFQDKLSTELAELTTAFDGVVERLQARGATLLSTQTRVETLLGSIRQLDAAIDEMMTTLSRLDAAAAADPNCASKLHAELKVNCLNSI